MPKQRELKQDFLKDILNKSLNEIYIFDAKTLKFLFVNQGACKNLGYSLEELYNLTPYAIKPDFNNEATFRAMLRPLLTKELDHLVFETVQRRKDGSRYPVEVHLQMIERDDGQVFLAIINDITDRKITQERLERQHKLNQKLLDAIPSPAWLITNERKIIAQNKAGQGLGAKIGDYCWDGIHHMENIPADQREYYIKTGVPAPGTQCFFCMADQMFAEKKTINKEIEFGGVPWDVWWIPIDDETYLHYAIDLTERKKTEGRLRKLTRIYALLSNIDHAIVRIREPQALFGDICRIAVEKGGFRMAWIGILDPVTQKIDAVACAGATNGYIDKLAIVLSDELRSNGPTGRALKTGAHVVCNDINSDQRMGPWLEDAISLGYRSSAAFPLNMAGGLKGVLNLYSDKPGFFDKEEIELLDELAMDISFAMEVAEKEEEKIRLEKQLLHAQKMETVGTLAGGVAHDFNNILTAIIGYGQVALMKMSKDDPNRKYIENMLEASDRAAKLTGSLLAFSRKSISDKRPIDINAVIKDVGKLLRRVMGEDIELKTECSKGELTVLADRNQLEQVLMNLAVNAKDAMPDGGTFTITTAETTIGDGFVKAHGYGRPGTYALITVSDTGMGMGKEVLEHIFEPFFTTKEVGKGTGLGLSVVYGIVKQHEGFINCYSEPGNGTTFMIYLPITASGTGEEDIRSKGNETDSQTNGTETILLAEDNEQVREFTKLVLTEAGYKVIEAIDGEDAVRKFMENKDDIQILLFDLIMPKKTGNDAYNEIKRLAPQIKALFMTGYSPELAKQKTSPENDIPVIYKPISPKDLLKKIRGVLR